MSKPIPPPPELPFSWHKGAGWLGHLDRCHRWLQRIRKTNDPYDIQDFLFSFYVDCFQLRDWLLENQVATKIEIDTLFNTNIELRLCGDVANAIKHMTLQMPKQPREFSMVREYAPGFGWFEPNSKLVILSEGQKFDMLDLAYKSIDVWIEFLRSKGEKITLRLPAFGDSA